MKPKIVKTCLKADAIEKFVLNKKLFNESNKLEIISHIYCCYSCYEQYYQIELYHRILSSELKKPVSQQIRNLVEEL